MGKPPSRPAANDPPVSGTCFFCSLVSPGRMLTTLAQYHYGFEGSTAVRIFMVGFAGLALVAALLIRLNIYQWIMAGMLFFTALTAPTNYEQTQYLQTWMLPVQLLRAEFHLALGILMTILVVVTGRVHVHTVPAQGMFLLAITLYSGFMQFFQEGPAEALQTIGFLLAVIPCMLFASPAASRDYENCVRVLRAMMWVSVLWTVCSSIQFVVNPRLVVNTNGRFWGMMANAQQTAILCAPCAVIATWLLLNDTKRNLKPLWIGLICINLLFVGWTASRNGVLMLLVGMAFVLYNRVGKLVLLLPVGALVFVTLAFLADELQIQSNLDRLTSTTNTRSGVWKAQLQAIAESPLVGVGVDERGGSESSWLGGFAAYGLGMFLLMMLFLFWSIWRCATLWIRRFRVPVETRRLIDMYISWNAMYFSAATFEGIILGRSSTSQTMMLMFAGIGVWLTEQVSQRVSDADGEFDENETDSEGERIVDVYAAGEYGFDDEGAPRQMA